MEHDAEARRGFARMGFGFVLLLASGFSRHQGWSFSSEPDGLFPL
jgi:hypothetical protein